MQVTNKGVALSVLVDLFAAIVAIIALFFAYKANKIANEALRLAELTPFEATLIASDPLWKVEPVRMGKKSLSSLALVATITIANRGAQQGCVANLQAHIELPITHDTIALRAYNFINEEKLLEVIRKGRPLNESYEGVFYPLLILGKQQISKAVLFRHPQLNQSEFREGMYNVTISGSDCNDPAQIRGSWKSAYVMTENEIPDLLRGRATVFEREENITPGR